MRWEDERYVRVYTRDTVQWMALGWEAQALFVLIMRKVDRAGVLEFKDGSYRGVAALFGMPIDVVQRAMAVLLEDGCVERIDTGVIIRNFIEAQEASMSPTMRQRESRERRRDMLRAGLDPSQRGTVIYFVQSEHGGPIKIGQADDLARRLVGLQTSRPDKLVVLASCEGTIADERRLHAAFASVREKGEWFSDSAELRALVAAVSRDGKLAIERVTRHETRQVTPVSQPPQVRPVTPSLAVPNLPNRTEREPARAHEEQTSSQAPWRGATSAIALPVEMHAKPPVEFREQAAMRGVENIDAEWSKFVDRKLANNDRSWDWSRNWHSWCTDAIKFQARDRDRDRNHARASKADAEVEQRARAAQKRAPKPSEPAAPKEVAIGALNDLLGAWGVKPDERAVVASLGGEAASRALDDAGITAAVLETKTEIIAEHPYAPEDEPSFSDLHEDPDEQPASEAADPNPF